MVIPLGNMMRLSVTTFTLLTCVVLLCTPVAASTPNVVIFFVDNLGYDDLGFTGHPTTKTPNLDKLATNGKILSSFYSGYPVCTASRASLLTGRQPPRISVPGVFGPTGNKGLPLN